MGSGVAASVALVAMETNGVWDVDVDVDVDVEVDVSGSRQEAWSCCSDEELWRVCL